MVWLLVWPFSGVVQASVRIMLGGAVGPGKQNSLMAEYSSLLAESVLRHKAWFAEHMARVETQLASKVKSEFIANMSHELRTPLNTVIGFAKLLGEHQKRHLKDNEIVEYADLIRDAATHLLAVINDILDISKMQSGKYTLDAREVDLDEILQVSLASFQPTALEVKVQLQSQIGPELPTVRGDPAKLRKVFANLIGNAIRFTPPGGRVGVEAHATKDGGATVCVRDTGLGMSSEEIAVALSPFAQVDASRSRWREGTGLGLPIAKALVQLHGGRLEIRSTKSLGTEVSVVLPSRFTVSDANDRASPGSAAGNPHSDRTRGNSGS
jgi:two-component system, cell cycle sensor histidine kinase PleC